MAHYLVTAIPRADRISELEARLARDEFRPLEPFGRALTKSLRGARRRPDGKAVWEEEDYCRPPLAEERAAVLDDYFDELSVEPVSRDSGWKRIDRLPPLFPNLPGRA
ncbi:MAG: hypothetical protein WD207_05865 [Xanthobacteraceae bacterium]